jgi:two-component system, sensor histidine kinase
MKRLTSIRRKMMAVVMLTTLAALTLSASALLLYELRSYRANWIADLKTQADLVAQSSVPALAFDDPRVAQENLSLLRLRPQIEVAAIYGANGARVASYAKAASSADGKTAPQWLDSREGHAFDGEWLDLRQSIQHKGERLGTMYLRARYDVVPRLWDYLAILFVASLASLGLASLVARRLQHTVTDPILAVADVARDVVQQRNYALRAVKTTYDEVGALVDAFNNMLGELGAQAQALQAADRRKDEFLATLAHELRNPLAPLSNALAILGRGDVDTALRDRLHGMMQRQLQQLVRLIDDLLEVSRISTGRLRLQLEALDLVEVLKAALESVRPVSQPSQHELVTHWPPSPVWVTGDRTRLVQVFINLLNNAAKYTDPGGRIELTLEQHAAQAEVVVKDNGIGIDPSMQDAVFEMFVQVEGSLQRGRQGLGVGLPLAKQLMTLHGGSLELSSEGLGRGCAFRVRLPLAPAPSAGANGRGAGGPTQ